MTLRSGRMDSTIDALSVVKSEMSFRFGYWKRERLTVLDHESRQNGSGPPEKLDEQGIEMQRGLSFQFLTSLLRL